nr:hypothetical protein Iba_chr05eCG6320 [Ipomoea batatas]
MIFSDGKRLQTQCIPSVTDMRFKNNIWASGTPFCMSNSMAWLAELPSSRTGSRSRTWRSDMSFGSFS